MEGTYRLFGDIGSPYSYKMRAVMRYRRLPHVWIMRSKKALEEIAHVKPPVIPVIQYPEDGSYHVDSTPMVYELEARHPGRRSVIPDDPYLAFLSHLIEDMADEWLTKAMYGYRWWREVDQAFCSSWLVNSYPGFNSLEERNNLIKFVRDRQVSRLGLVGCNENTMPIIEKSFLEITGILDKHFLDSPYLFGTRPSLADFGLYGQLSQLNRDPTPRSILINSRKMLSCWIDKIEDASGEEEGTWFAPENPLPEAVIDLLKIVGDVYFPFLLANAAALEKEAETFSVTLMGATYEQGAFRYQAKCLKWLREEYASLAGEAKEKADAVLKDTGCLEPLQVQ
jgi:glutathione S-transferase